MSYGSIKADQIIYPIGSGTGSRPINELSSPSITGQSGLFTDVVSGALITGVSGVFASTVTGSLITPSGIFTSLSGNAITGTTIGFTTGTIPNVEVYYSVSGTKFIVETGIISLEKNSVAASKSIDFSGNVGFYASGTSNITFASGTTNVVGLRATGINIHTSGATTTGNIKLFDSGNVNYVALVGRKTLSGNVTFTLPTGSGASGQVLQTDGSGKLSWVTASLSNPAITYNEYTGSTTWNKPSGCVSVYVECVSAGGGGGGGRCGTSGSNNCGGKGAAGGFFAAELFSAAAISGTVDVTVGAPGSGGAGGPLTVGDGSGGTIGGDSSFGPYLFAPNRNTQNGGGGGGTINEAGGNAFAIPLLVGTGGRNTTAGISGNGGASPLGPGGGGAGVTLTASINSSFAGGAGFMFLKDEFAGAPSQGITQGSGGLAGSNGSAGSGGPTYGDGGGGGSATFTGAGGAGGSGAFPGGGGGGGGAAISGYNGGNGGAGGAGVVKVWTW